MADKPHAFVVNAETGEHGYVEMSVAERKAHAAAQKELADNISEPATVEDRVAAAVTAALKAALPGATAKQIKAAEQAARKAAQG